MKKIKENDLKEVMKLFDNKNLKLIIEGSINQFIEIENSNIIFLEKESEIKVHGDCGCTTINLGFVEEIILLDKNKLKFLIENQLEILIIIL